MYDYIYLYDYIYFWTFLDILDIFGRFIVCPRSSKDDIWGFFEKNALP